MLEYTKLKQNRRRFLSLTGLTQKEFQALLPPFGESYQRRYQDSKTFQLGSVGVDSRKNGKKSYLICKQKLTHSANQDVLIGTPKHKLL